MAGGEPAIAFCADRLAGPRSFGDEKSMLKKHVVEDAPGTAGRDDVIVMRNANVACADVLPNAVGARSGTPTLVF